jgi:SPP1 family predicted phage head-tail adaptor
MAARERLGARRRRLFIEAPVLTPDGAGGAAESFTLQGRAWAGIRWLSGDERWRADRAEQSARIEVTMRWRAGVTAGMRLRDGARLFNIITAGDPAGDRARLVCLCEEITP